jgi:hypothetical protein
MTPIQEENRAEVISAHADSVVKSLATAPLPDLDRINDVLSAELPPDSSTIFQRQILFGDDQRLPEVHF